MGYIQLKQLLMLAIGRLRKYEKYNSKNLHKQNF